VFFVCAIIVWFNLVCIAYCLLSTMFAWWIKILKIHVRSVASPSIVSPWAVRAPPSLLVTPLINDVGTRWRLRQYLLFTVLKTAACGWSVAAGGRLVTKAGICQSLNQPVSDASEELLQLTHLQTDRLTETRWIPFIPTTKRFD